MTSFYTGHHRNSSAAQQLITTSSTHDNDEEEQVEIYTSPVLDSPGRVGTLQSQGAGSECSSYYMPANYVPQAKRRSPLRANIRVVIVSIMLTLVGISLLAFGVFVMVIPHNTDHSGLYRGGRGINGWIFLIVGLLFFIPGFYHVVYITCTLCGRPGYSFDNLPTFNK